MKRNFIRYLAKDIINEVDKIKKNPKKLKELIDEIKFRKKASEKLKPTLEKAKKYLEENSKKYLDKIKESSSFKKVTKELNELKETIVKEKYFENEEAKIDLEDNIKEEVQSDKQSTINNDSSRINSNIEAPMFYSLFGAKDLNIQFNGYEIISTYNDSNTKICVSDISKVQSTKGWFFVDVSIHYNDEVLNLKKLTKKQAFYLESRIKLLTKQDQINLLLDQFNKILSLKEYVNHNKINTWILNAKNIVEEIIDPVFLITNSLSENEKQFYKYYKDCDELILNKNKVFLKSEKDLLKSFFDKLESNPLTESQRNAIVTEEDSTLVVAGAGTGKTSPEMGKISYILKRKIVAPNHILALAFGRDAAEEMRERVKKHTGDNIEIRTFHSLGLHIVNTSNDSKITISDSAKYEKVLLSLIARIFQEMSKNKRTRDLLLNFVSKHRYPAKYLEDFNTTSDYFEYLRKFEPMTLNGEMVKSFEELLIADWLNLNGIDYAYEHPYEAKTSSRLRKQYRPDFYIKEKGIYLEHFGIGKKGETAPGIDNEEYHRGIKWKRETHQINNTILIETYSWERQEGKLLPKLEKKLNSHGIFCKPNDAETIKRLLETREINKKLVALVKDFLNVFKEGQYRKEELNNYVENASGDEKERCLSFLELFFEFFDRYQSHLSSRQEYDFADLIVKATDIVKDNKIRLNFRRIIVDEYQDISRGRFRLIQAIIGQQKDCRIMCVGDDWQSIYGFTGSDITMTLNFEKLFGFASRVDLDQSFRFTQPILDVSSRFIQKNESQLKKTINAKKPILSNSIEIFQPEPSQEFDLIEVLKIIDNNRPKDKSWNVILLGRYNFCNPELSEDEKKQFKNLDIVFMTIHKSKGLQADAIVVLELKTGRFGFPGQIETDPLMKMVIPGEDKFENAEERRVLYVALTRAKQKVILCADSTNPSEFINELKTKEYPEVKHEDYLHGEEIFNCPKCKNGKLYLKYQNRKNGYAWVCSLSPYCDGKAKYCNKCFSLPAINGSNCNYEGCRITHAV